MAEEIQIVSDKVQKKRGVWKDKFRKRFRKLRKKKSFWIVTILVVIVLAGGIGFVVVKAKNSKNATVTTTVQSAEAATGTISTTVEGTGTLANAETVDVVVPTGVTVDSVLVSSGDTVTKGQQLATLNQTSIIQAMISAQDSLDSLEDQLEDTSDLSDLEVEELNAEKADVEEALSTLTSLHESPVITATEAGVIDSVNVSDDTEITKSGSSGSSTGSVTGTSSDSSSSVTKTAYNVNSGNMFTSLSYSSSGNNGFTATSSEAAEQGIEEQGTTAYSNDNMTIISNYDDLKITPPVANEIPQSEITVGDDSYYTGTITWNCTGKKFQAGTVYTATIVLTANDGYTFAESCLPVIDCSAFNWTVYDQGTTGNRLKIEATFEATASDAQNSSNGSGVDGGTSGSAGDSSNQTASGNASGSSASGSSSSGSSASGSSTSGSSSATGSSNSDVYSSYETAAFTIAKQDNVVISVSVDELDILSVEKGQTATVTMDAIDGEKFDGTITTVSTTASSSGSGSSAKYAVEITIPKEDDMLIGMSASAVINISESENAVLIPIDALQEKGDSTFVYTQKDSDGNLSGEVEVETGLSNGSQVEITSGLSNGDTVYYLKTSSSDSSSDSNMRGGMGEMSGDMPSGGSMPSGDMPSGGGDSSGSKPSGGGQAPSN